MTALGQHPARTPVTDIPFSSTASPILLVDDNAAKRLALRSVLLPLGHPIVEADSGAAALRCIMVQDFAVILLDVRMPVMDGFETAALIRLRRQSEMTPIIFITAYAGDEINATDRYVEGAVDFMFAPVPPDELRAKVSVFANLFVQAAGLAASARQVKTSADQLRLLTEAAPIGIFQTDTLNRYVYTNPRWTEITGVEPGAAIGQPWDSILDPDQRTGLRTASGGDRTSPGEISHRFVIGSPGSPPRVVLVTSRAVPATEGGMAGWVGTLADVTAEAGAEVAMSDARDRATEASRLKSDFLANMSHEIRTPMNGVLGMTDLLLETDLDPRQRDYAQTVRNSGEALLTIINDILDFSKVEAGKLDIEQIDFNVRTMVGNSVDLLARRAQGKGLELISIIDETVPVLANGDPGRVRQVLSNMIDNAVKFTAAGQVVLRVTCSELQDAGSKGAEALLRFEISDTGDGIAPNKLNAIFQPFIQGDSSTTRKHGGTGLGLTISQHLVSLMGGECGVSSQLGLGSTFWFTIRVHVNAGQARHAPQRADADLAGLRALIVDDNATQRLVLSGLLSGWGMAVSTADSGRAALAAMRSAAGAGRPYAVALVDGAMPGMSGVEVRAAILGDPEIAAGVLLLTGMDQSEATERDGGPLVGAAVSKPIRPESLRAGLRVVLRMPPTPDAPPPMIPQPSSESTADRPAAGRLLLAEDNLINQKVAVAMLSKAGYRVDTVLNGAAAVEAAAATAYDAILMDCQMPELNGYEATAAIRAAQMGSGRRTPIIALTAGARQEDRERCLAEGMDSYLAKPMSKDALLAVVESSLRTT